MNAQRTIISPHYKPAVLFALILQACVALFAMLLLDGGRTSRIVGVAALAFWLAASIVILRRRWSPTTLDLALIRWAFWPILIAATAFDAFA